jgi:hypothetical protein
MRLCPGVKGDHVAFLPQRGTFGEFVHVGTNREVGAIDAVQFIRVGMDMDQGLSGMLERDKLVPVGRSLAETGANDEDDNGRLYTLNQLGIGPIA